MAMQGEVSRVHDGGSVTVRLHGYGVPITTTGEHLSLVAALSSLTMICVARHT